MDVLVKNKKTGQEKILPQKVYEQLKHAWFLIDELGETVDQDYKKKVSQSQSVLPVIDTETFDTGAKIVIIDNTHMANDIAEYSRLSGGKKADGRWSPEKLKAKIQELKTIENEDK
jgi:hypothetical protein